MITIAAFVASMDPWTPDRGAAPVGRIECYAAVSLDGLITDA